MLFPLFRISSTTSALYSAENARRFRFAMAHSYRTFVRSGVSTKPGKLNPGMESVGSPAAADVPRAPRGAESGCVQQCQELNLKCGGPNNQMCNALLRDCYEACAPSGQGANTP